MVEVLLRDLEGAVKAAGGGGSGNVDGGSGGGGSGGGAEGGSVAEGAQGAYAERLARLRSALGELQAGATGGARRHLEAEMQSELREIGAELRGEARVAEGYCGSCHGAAGSGRCCNTCEEVSSAAGGKGLAVGRAGCVCVGVPGGVGGGGRKQGRAGQWRGRTEGGGG